MNEGISKLTTMRRYDILPRHCRLPGGSLLTFIILRAPIWKYVNSISTFEDTDMANFQTLYGFNPASWKANGSKCQGTIVFYYIDRIINRLFLI